MGAASSHVLGSLGRVSWRLAWIAGRFTSYGWLLLKSKCLFQLELYVVVPTIGPPNELSLSEEEEVPGCIVYWTVL